MWSVKNHELEYDFHITTLQKINDYMARISAEFI